MSDEKDISLGWGSVPIGHNEGRALDTGEIHRAPLLRRIEGLEAEVERLKVAAKKPREPSACDNAIDKIAVICGCPEWEYAAQVIRDVKALRAELTERTTDRDVTARAAAALRAEVKRLTGLCIDAARIGYEAGHHDTVESRYADPREIAEDIVGDLITDARAAPSEGGNDDQA